MARIEIYEEVIRIPGTRMSKIRRTYEWQGPIGGIAYIYSHTFDADNLPWPLEVLMFEQWSCCYVVHRLDATPNYAINRMLADWWKLRFWFLRKRSDLALALIKHIAENFV